MLRKVVPEYMRSTVSPPILTTPRMNIIATACASRFAGCECFGAVRVKWGSSTSEQEVVVELYTLRGVDDCVGSWHPVDGCTVSPRSWYEDKDIMRPPKRPRNTGLPVPRMHVLTRAEKEAPPPPLKKRRRKRGKGVRTRVEGGN